MLLLFITAFAGTAYIGACMLRLPVIPANVSAVEIAFDPLDGDLGHDRVAVAS